MDVAIFDDGLCVGPDTAGMVSSITESLELQRANAEDVAAAIRNGASPGKIFEMLLPLARRMRPGSTERHEELLLPMFARMAIDQLINADPPNQLTWFERLARPSALQLYRPG